MSGITTQTQAADNLLTGQDYKTKALPLDASVGTASRGQVLKYDATGHNWVKHTGGAVSVKLAVLLEDVAISADTPALCLVAGEVNLDSLDATCAADADIDGMLLLSGIDARSAQPVE